MPISCVCMYTSQLQDQEKVNNGGVNFDDVDDCCEKIRAKISLCARSFKLTRKRSEKICLFYSLSVAFFWAYE